MSQPPELLGENYGIDHAKTVSRSDYRAYPKTGIGRLPLLPSLGTARDDSGPTGGRDILLVSEESDPENGSGTDEGQGYVEFDLGSKFNSSAEGWKQMNVSSRSSAVADTNHEEMSATEASPQPKSALDPVKEDDFFSSESAAWNQMKKVTADNYYDEMGNLEFSRDHSFGLFEGNSRKEYTKIDTEEQLIKYASLDTKTDFLFRSHSSSRLHASASEASKAEDSEEEFDDESENVNSDETLAGTRGMLRDSQKFAYVGIIKLITVEMATDLALLNQKTTNKVAKKLNLGQKNFANWTMYIMSKLFDHLEVSQAEQQMISNLSMHGVETSDLMKSLLLLDLKNPKLEKEVQGFDLRWVLACDLFLLLLSDGYYDSRSRTLLFRFSSNLNLSGLEVRQFERRLIESLEMDTSHKTIENRDDKLRDRLFIEKHIQKNHKKKLAYIGLATLGGSLAIGLSAGLLAPVIGAGLAAGLTTVGITGTSGFLAGVGGSVAITTGGVAIGAKVGNKAGARRMGDVNTFEMKPLHNNKRSNLIISVSGWMNGEMDDVRLPFSTVDPVMGDMFSLLWEPEMLRSMGQTIGILASEALSTSIQQILGATILTALMSAIQLPMLLSKLSYLLDNPWNVSLDRAWKAGKILADTLISGNMGVRPITLVGFSLGSRLIYSCLIELANRGGFGLIDNVILLGNPATVKYDQITLARSVVSGRFINGYTRNDWILGYLFRATGGGLLTVSGISPIKNIPGVENFDCSLFVEGHMSYRKAIPKILKALDWEVLSDEFAEIEEPDIEQRERQRKLLDEFDEARAKMEREAKEEKTKQKSWKNWFKPKQKNWWELYDESEQTEAEKTNDQFEEYDELAQNVFDVNALVKEVQDIERIGQEATGETLQELRNNTTEQDLHYRVNEDIEEDAENSAVFKNLGTKLGSLRR
ncbi:DUF726-domain-containing protein [Metschnikowia bicuspidata var. bicuspidata NRRL YB-4993]|uniref:DUF726-domain-containing protein n=1 Tax=Metschnikowia bicuspidata var. bicuspidata NRRL YB-4993 TaxID=869754 RepID=A0A1A0GZ91_9ASCO|nr:DUF726-domain-containing protein [Metschnikowia bicuspidata var. bicuspidata NRRL YB-4993]OBA17010.1 DUF726-domain-containing protein [Metschnikowia bicuspidata var. bicuspidata NRRL YB-4993]